MLSRVLPELWDPGKDGRKQLGGLKKKVLLGSGVGVPAYQPSQGDIRRSLADSMGPDCGTLG